MSVILLGSLGQSPGVSTIATGLALTWPRPVILVEADISKPSSVLPGLLKGEVTATSGLNTLVELTGLRGPSQLTVATMWPALIKLPSTNPQEPERFLLHGFSNPVAGRGATNLWGELASALNELHEGGVDAIVDFGRWNGIGDRPALLRRADLAVWATRNTLPGIAATAASLPQVTVERASGGRATDQAILECEAPSGAFPTGEIRKYLQADVLGSIPFSPRAADMYSVGSASRSAASRHFERALKSVGTAMARTAEQARNVLLPKQVK